LQRTVDIIAELTSGLISHDLSYWCSPHAGLSCTFNRMINDYRLEGDIDISTVLKVRHSLSRVSLGNWALWLKIVEIEDHAIPLFKQII
jgi:hypothetical protein